MFEQCFAGLPAVNARDLVASWRPGYGEWLAAQVAEGFDHTTTARVLEEKGIALEEATAGQRDPGWELRNDGATAGDALRRAFALKGWTPPEPDHVHAMTEADWKASPWYRKEIPFRPDMTATRARVMAANFDNRRYRDALIARGGEAYGGAGSMALGFGAALLGALPDPVNLLSLGGGMAAASRAATLGGALRAGAKAGAAEGAAFTALADAVVLPDLATRGEDADFADLALDTLAGGVLGAVFGAAGGALARRSARRAAAATADAAVATPDATAATAATADAAVDAAPFDATLDNAFLERATAPAPFEATPDGFLARAGEGPATRPGETFLPGEPLSDVDASLDNGFLERAGQGPRTRPGETIYLGDPLPDLPGPAPLPEGMHWKQRVELAFTPETPTGADQRRMAFARDQHEQSAAAARQARIERARAEAPARNAALEAALREAAEKAAARNADNDLLRAGMTAADRDAAARSLELATTDLTDGRPVDVAAVLEASGALERALREGLSPVVVRSEDLGVQEGAGLPAYIAAAKRYHDALKLESESGKPVIQPQLEKPVRFSRKGWFKNKSNGADADKWKLFPKLREIIETSTLKSTESVSKPRKDGFVRFHWVENVVELDGSPRLVGVMLAEDTDGNLFYNINADVEGWRAKKGDPSNLPAVSNAGESGSPLQAEAVASPVEASMAKDADGINMRVEDLDPPKADFSPAPEPPAPPRMTPDEARRAEADALAGQDEALRQHMEELEARGALDPDEAASARADAESTEGIGREALDCAWTAEG